MNPEQTFSMFLVVAASVGILNWIAPILGAAGMFFGAKENEKNRNAAKDASDRAADLQQQGLDLTKGQLDRQNAWQDLIKGIVTGADKGGLFDADAQIRQLEHDNARTEKMSLNNLGQTFANMGYRPGDTVPQQSISYLAGHQADSRDQMRMNLRRQTFFDKLGAYQAMNPASGNQAASMAAASASQGANTALHQSQIAGSKIQNPANFLAGFMPFLQGAPQQQQQNQPGFGGDASNTDIGLPPVTYRPGY